MDLENCTKVDFGSHADWGFQDNKSSLCPCNHVESIVAEGESSTFRGEKVALNAFLMIEEPLMWWLAWATICWAM